MKIIWSQVEAAFDSSYEGYPNDEINESDLRDMLKKFSNKVDELINRVNEPEPELEESQSDR